MPDFRETATDLINSYVAGLQVRKSRESELKDQLEQVGIKLVPKKFAQSEFVEKMGGTYLGDIGSFAAIKVPTQFELAQKQATGEARAKTLGELGFVSPKPAMELAQIPEAEILNRIRIAAGGQPLQDVGLPETVRAISKVPLFKKPASGVLSPEELKQKKELISFTQQEQAKYSTTAFSDFDTKLSAYKQQNPEATTWDAVVAVSQLEPSTKTLGAKEYFDLADDVLDMSFIGTKDVRGYQVAMLQSLDPEERAKWTEEQKKAWEDAQMLKQLGMSKIPELLGGTDEELKKKRLQELRSKYKK